MTMPIAKTSSFSSAFYKNLFAKLIKMKKGYGVVKYLIIIFLSGNCNQSAIMSSHTLDFLKNVPVCH